MSSTPESQIAAIEQKQARLDSLWRGVSYLTLVWMLIVAVITGIEKNAVMILTIIVIAVGVPRLIKDFWAKPHTAGILFVMMYTSFVMLNFPHLYVGIAGIMILVLGGTVAYLSGNYERQITALKEAAHD